MVSLWYPARHGGQRAPWLPTAAARLYRQQAAQSLRTSLDDVDFPMTHARLDASVLAPRHGHPVVLFSPGAGAMRESGTSLVEDLASRGYVVVTISHTYDSQIVEFPGGRLELSMLPDKPTDAEYEAILRVRRDDTRFVLNSLSTLPPGLQRALDLSRIGMFGHSLGGAAAAAAMARDPRIRVGADLDGSPVGDVVHTGLTRPFLLMASAGHGRENDPDWAEFWSHLRGWRRELNLRGSGHQTYTDLGQLAPQLIKALPIPPEVVDGLRNDIGTINAGRAVAIQRAYLAAFFELHLRHRDDHLLDGPSRRYPEIEFVP